MPTLRRSASARSIASLRERPRTWIGASITFWSTVMCDQRLNCWNTMPSRVRKCSTWRRSTGSSLPVRFGFSRSSSPATTIRPRSGCSRRLMQRRKVLLPEPEAPRRAITSPLRAVTEMPFSTSIEPKLLWMFSATSAGAASGMQPLLCCASKHAGRLARQVRGRKDGTGGGRRPHHGRSNSWRRRARRSKTVVAQAWRALERPISASVRSGPPRYRSRARATS